jgi:hypothetical protein
VFYEREPYKNIKESNLTTRFIGLPMFAPKQKWFYAMNYTFEKKVEKATQNPFLQLGKIHWRLFEYTKLSLMINPLCL